MSMMGSDSGDGGSERSSERPRLHGYRAQSTFSIDALRGSKPEASERSTHIAAMLRYGLPAFDPAWVSEVRPPKIVRTTEGKIVLIEENTPISDQRTAGSCTSQGRCDALELVMPPGKVVQLARRQMYWCSRWEHGDQDEDAGSWSHVSAAIATHVGVAREELWPYSDKLADIIKRPTLETLLDAARHRVPDGSIQRIVGAGRVRTDLAKAALSLGCPVVIDKVVGEDYCRGPARNKAVFAPERSVGGHCTILVGFWERSDGGLWFRERNSWGDAWCDDGHCWLDASYVGDALATEEMDVTTAPPIFLS